MSKSELQLLYKHMFIGYMAAFIGAIILGGFFANSTRYGVLNQDIVAFMLGITVIALGAIFLFLITHSIRAEGIALALVALALVWIGPLGVLAYDHPDGRYIFVFLGAIILGVIMTGWGTLFFSFPFELWHPNYMIDKNDQGQDEVINRIGMPSWDVIIKREMVRINNQITRANHTDGDSALSVADWAYAIAYFNGKCAYCQQNPFEALDHYIPVMKNGKTTADNSLPVCNSCNSRKGAKNPVEILSGEVRERIETYFALQGLGKFRERQGKAGE